MEVFTFNRERLFTIEVHLKWSVNPSLGPSSTNIKLIQDSPQVSCCIPILRLFYKKLEILLGKE